MHTILSGKKLDGSPVTFPPNANPTTSDPEAWLRKKEAKGLFQIVAEDNAGNKTTYFLMRNGEIKRYRIN
ncbi:MAG: hypothetical protein AB1768_19560 [Pseudomonadota bacterium]|jgi:hypothetical protein